MYCVHVGVHADMHLVTLHAIRMRNEAAVINRLPFLLPVPDYVRADEVSEVASDVADSVYFEARTLTIHDNSDN